MLSVRMRSRRWTCSQLNTLKFVLSVFESETVLALSSSAIVGSVGGIGEVACSTDLLPGDVARRVTEETHHALETLLRSVLVM